MFQPKVLPLFTRPREKDYRAAVAKIIRDLKAKHGLTNTMLAEEIGCCPETISNAENENNALGAVTLGNIRFRFGAAAVAPWDLICDGHCPEPRTLSERLKAALDELDQIQREIERQGIAA